jgi:plastocyanin
LAITSALTLGVLGISVTPAAAATHTISMKNLSYNPSSLDVAVGDTVVWSNDESVSHSVSGTAMESPEILPGAKYSFTFSSAGTYDFHCRFHPDMVGKIVVGSSAPPTPTESATPTPTTTTSPTASPTTTTTAPTTAPPATTSSSTAPSGSTPGGTGTTGGGGAPVGVGPLPVAIDLTDNNGSWYDTHLNLGSLGGQSLAVAELPRVNLGTVLNQVPTVNSSGIPGLDTLVPVLSGLSGISGLTDLLALGGGQSAAGASASNTGAVGLGGGLAGASSGLGLNGVASLPLLSGGSVPLLGSGAAQSGPLSSLLNLDLPGLSSVSGVGKLPLVGALGVDSSSLLNLDALSQAVTSLLPVGDPRLAQANALLGQLADQVAAQPAGVPIALDQLPVGADLQALLSNLQEFAGNDISLPVTVNFTVAAPQAASAHTVTSLIYPDGAKGFPVDQPGAWVGQTSMQLTEPGLYAFACKVHPYMLGAIVVDDPLTPGLDFGKKLHVNSRGLTVPSDADIITNLVTKFFNITMPSNWQKFSNTKSTTWNPSYPPAPILMYDKDGRAELVPSLDAFLKAHNGTPKTLPALTQRPTTPGVGEVWVDTQMEQFAGKTKVGAATKINASTWAVEQKVSLPEINMNNPHNMWTDKDEKFIYQTEWFNNKLDVFERETGKFVRQIEVGPDPSHVMTRTDTDQLHVALNGGGAVMELSPGGTRIDRRIPVQSAGEKIAHPHAHWMTGDGSTMVTPNVNSYDSTIVDVKTGNIRKEATGELPIATGITADGSKAYEANFLGATVSCISLKADACNQGGAKVHHKEIDLWGNYDPVAGAHGQYGGLPIQIPVAPDNSAVLVANTLTANIAVIDPKTDEIVKWLPCDSGCHGINFGAKKGGGYYAYVSSKFSNAMQIIDPDPNGDGNPEDAAIVGKMAVSSGPNTKLDSPIKGYDGFGGMGVLTVPIAYNGWVQNAPSNPINDQLTCRQRHPVTFAEDCS